MTIYQVYEEDSMVWEGTSKQFRNHFNVNYSPWSYTLNGSRFLKKYTVKIRNDEDGMIWKIQNLNRYGNTICKEDELEDVIDGLRNVGIEVTYRKEQNWKDNTTHKKKDKWYILEKVWR